MLRGGERGGGGEGSGKLEILESGLHEFKTGFLSIAGGYSRRPGEQRQLQSHGRSAYHLCIAG